MVGRYGIRTREGIRTESGTEPADSGPPTRYDAV